MLALPEGDYDHRDIDAIVAYAHASARENFWHYRQLINPRMIIGWWQREVAYQLQKFYNAWMAGLRPKLILQSPPQHGKSKQVTDFISWVAGKHADKHAIYASYSDRLGTRANLNLQRIMDHPTYRGVFPETQLPMLGVNYGSRFLRNTDIFEYVGTGGSFRNTTVRGGVTGEGLDLGVIDDPIKGRLEAMSERVRNNVWGWVTDDFLTRFSDLAALLLIMTRWHLDDPAGRMVQEFPGGVTVLRYPALAEDDIDTRVTGDKRKPGEPLFPELKSLAFLMERKRLLTQSGWEAIYQQNPIIIGGGFFPIDKFEFVRARPPAHMVVRSVRYWDKAGTQDDGAYTAGSLVEELKDKRLVVSHMARGQWSSLERENRIKQHAIMDNADRRVETWVEQEPGSGGKESAENTIRNLKGFVVKADRVTGDKVSRAEPYAAQVQGGNVFLVTAEWNDAFLNEHETFPNSKYKDQVDATAGAVNKVAGRLGEAVSEAIKGLY